MPRSLSRNRRMAVVTAASASVLAGSISLFSTAHTTLSSQERGIGVGLLCAACAFLLTTSFVFLKRENASCSRSQTPGT